MNTTRISAEMCREQAKAIADEIRAITDTEYRVALATIGSFWTDLGQLNLALGDPDEFVEVLAQRRRHKL